jgi:plastocyanin
MAPPAAPRVAAVAALLLVGSPAAAAPRSFTVVIDRMQFGRTPSELHRGDAIVWVNKDMFQHTASASDGSFDVVLAPGARARTVLKRSGRITFVCRYHPGMRGKLEVK